jgi:hypothetical protein
MHKLAGLARSAAMTLTVLINLTTVAVALGTFAVIYARAFLRGFSSCGRCSYRALSVMATAFGERTKNRYSPFDCIADQEGSRSSRIAAMA